MRKKLAMVIAPHPDDEINLAGQVLPYLQENNFKIDVVYTTNGDSEKKIGNKRLQEALDACDVLGIPSENVIFLGYANEWEECRHLYNEDYDVQLTSRLGKCETNGLEDHCEFSFKKNGFHKSFTKRNFIDDLHDVIDDLKPDLIICVDFDTHPDHRMTTLAFDEAMCRILKKCMDYHPLILKRFAYNGTWKGNKDYYSYKKTKLKYGFKYLGGNHDLESPAYSKNDEIRILADEKTITSLLTKNILYKAAKKHKCTVAWYQMLRVINRDMVYFIRNTYNLMLQASIIASSGNVNYLNDFKIYDVTDVLKTADPFGNVECCWRPNDTEKSFIAKWNEKISVKEIIVYEDANVTNHIKILQITLGDLSINVEPHQDGSATRIKLNKNIVTDTIHGKILECVGNPGLAEVEVLAFDQIKTVEELLDIKDGQKKLSNIERYSAKVEKLVLDLQFLFKFKIRYEIKRRINYIRR